MVSPTAFKGSAKTGVSIHDLPGDLERVQKGKAWEQENQRGYDLPSPMAMGS